MFPECSQIIISRQIMFINDPGTIPEEIFGSNSHKSSFSGFSEMSVLQVSRCRHVPANIGNTCCKPIQKFFTILFLHEMHFSLFSHKLHDSNFDIKKTRIENSIAFYTNLIFIVLSDAPKLANQCISRIIFGIPSGADVTKMIREIH